jgi:hypothetical protein
MTAGATSHGLSSRSACPVTVTSFSKLGVQAHFTESHTAVHLCPALQPSTALLSQGACDPVQIVSSRTCNKQCKKISCAWLQCTVPSRTCYLHSLCQVKLPPPLPILTYSVMRYAVICHLLLTEAGCCHCPLPALPAMKCVPESLSEGYRAYVTLGHV